MQRGWALVVCCGVAHAFIQSASSWRRARPARSPQRVGSRLRSVCLGEVKVAKETTLEEARSALQERFEQWHGARSVPQW